MFRPLIGCALLLAVATIASAQERSSAAYTTTRDLHDVRPFASWVTDATQTQGIDLEPELRYQDFDLVSRLIAGARVAAWVHESIEVGGRWGFASSDPEIGEGTSGLRDLDVYGRYLVDVDERMDLSVGTEFSLPVGDEELGGGYFDFRGFGALRYDVDGNLTVLGHLGFDSSGRSFFNGQEVVDDRELGLFLGAGMIVPVTEEMAVIAEFDLDTSLDDTKLTGGIDYELPPGGHLRGAMAIGLDDGAPDFEVILGFAIPVY